jgi:hypothetical protein
MSQSIFDVFEQLKIDCEKAIEQSGSIEQIVASLQMCFEMSGLRMSFLRGLGVLRLANGNNALVILMYNEFMGKWGLSLKSSVSQPITHATIETRVERLTAKSPFVDEAIAAIPHMLSDIGESLKIDFEKRLRIIDNICRELKKRVLVPSDLLQLVHMICIENEEGFRERIKNYPELIDL